MSVTCLPGAGWEAYWHGSVEEIADELLSRVGDAGFRRRVRLAFLRP